MPRSLYMKYYLYGAVVIILDQITKLLVRTHMHTGESISVIGDFFRITYVKNTGAAFSMFSGERLLLVVVPILIVILAFWYFHNHKDEHWLFYTSWTMIIGGGLGNLIDRIVFGWVTDMLDFSIFPPVFNIADIGVTVGCGLFIYYTLAGERLWHDESQRTEV